MREPNPAMASFDEAAKVAETDFKKWYNGLKPEDKFVVNEVAVWWKKHFMNAGHKRLGRIIANLKN